MVSKIPCLHNDIWQNGNDDLICNKMDNDIYFDIFFPWVAAYPQVVDHCRNSPCHPVL